MIEVMARLWWQVESQSYSDLILWENLEEAQREEIRERCLKLINGELRPESEADKLVYIGRKRTNEDLFKRVLHGGIKELTWGNYWDSLVGPSIGPMYQSPILTNSKLFCNTNIGNTLLCNLHVAGRLGYDQDDEFIADRIYCRTFIDDQNSRGVEELLHSAIASVRIGNETVAKHFLSELFYEGRRIERLIKSRTVFLVDIEIDYRKTRLANEVLKGPLYIHVEGVNRKDVE